ncbi:hypothetical protein SO802_021956 [Lithocarpus litseifolius]|uniref:Uncharacterized protein n=1 Tax=Lithocarpus litseifolius TaxID=425828 RepID=A0AAW2CJQ2_9ROSI
MILVDACFILEHLIRCSSRVDAVMLDLLLLENQLPFFVIEKLYDLASPSLSKANPSLSSDHGLFELSFNYFNYAIFNKQFIKALPNIKIEHFTDLVRTFHIAPPKMQPKRGYEMINCMYTATQLHDAGVKVTAVKVSESCFDMKFKKGVLEIPILELNDWTEIVAENVIALEQTRYIEEGYFTDYFIFMDLLIKTTKDVDLLCNKNILFNCLDDSYAAKSMIKNLNKGILLINMRDDYVELGKELNFFCRTPGRMWMAALKREYFGVTLSVITVLTLIQTVCSIMQVTGSS